IAEDWGLALIYLKPMILVFAALGPNNRFSHLRSPSRRVSIIVVKHSTEPLAPADRSCLFRDTLDWNNKPIPESLMVPFGMIMCNEIVSCISQRILAKEDHLLQARFLNSSDEPFRERIQIWGSRWQFDGLDTRVRKTG